MTQYELRWAQMPLPIGRRPVLLLARPEAYEYLQKVMVAEVTTRVRGIPQEVPVGPREGLVRPSAISLDNVHVVDRSCIGDRIGFLAHARHDEVKRALGHALKWSELQALGLST